MSKKIVKKEEVKLTKKYTRNEAKDYVLKSCEIVADPERMLRDFAEKSMSRMYSQEKVDEKDIEEAKKKISDLSLALSTETGFMLMKSVNKQYHSLALQMKRNLQEEFDCKTTSEKMLTDLAVNSYIRNLCYSDRMEQIQENLGKDYNNYRNYFSKEIDCAHRQFISALETLKFIKQPSMKVNIKTNTAFVGENQQFNNNVENNESK
jgi:hypothetical protein